MLRLLHNGGPTLCSEEERKTGGETSRCQVWCLGTPTEWREHCVKRERSTRQSIHRRAGGKNRGGGCPDAPHQAPALSPHVTPFGNYFNMACWFAEKSALSHTEKTTVGSIGDGASVRLLDGATAGLPLLPPQPEVLLPALGGPPGKPSTGHSASSRSVHSKPTYWSQWARRLGASISSFGSSSRPARVGDNGPGACVANAGT